MSREAAIFEHLLKSRGLKFTPQRRAILRAVFAVHDHFDADELYLRLKAANRRVSRTSVYRTLPLLAEAGLIRETYCGQDAARYEHVLGHKHHDHLFCLKCGKVIEFADERIEKLQEAASKKRGFQMTDHTFVIRGFCKRCR